LKGRKPTPTALKLLKGNPGNRPVNKNEPKYSFDIPKPIHTLNKYGKKEWERICTLLESTKLLTEADWTALSCYCQCFGRWVKAEENVKNKGMLIKTKNGNLVHNPYLDIANRCMKQMQFYLTEFGFTPSSRSKVGDFPPGGKSKNPSGNKPSEFEAFRNKKNKKG